MQQSSDVSLTERLQHWAWRRYHIWYTRIFST